MDNTFLQEQNPQQHGKALPEPRFIKREILYYRRQTLDAASDYPDKPNYKVLRRWRSNLVNWYLTLQPHLNRSSINEETLEDLNRIEQWLDSPGTNNGPEQYRQFTRSLNQAMMDIGILDIGIRDTTDQPFGYEFLEGLDFNMDTSDAGFKRLMLNVDHMAELQTHDVDIAGLIFGGNRSGKTTLSLQMVIRGNQHHGMELEKQNIIISDEDFWNATQDTPKYSWNHGDEWSRIMYSKDAMTKDQKKRKKMLKTYAVENKALIACDTSFFDVDREFREDKLKFAIRIPKRGRFEFYDKSKLSEFERDPETGNTITPEPTFTGSFPELTGPKWELYKSQEDRKMEFDNEEEEESVDTAELADQVVKEEERFKKEWVQGGKIIINKTKIAAVFDISDREAAKVKEKAEDQLGLPRPIED